MTMAAKTFTQQLMAAADNTQRPDPHARDREWADWAEELGQTRFYDPFFDWLDAHPWIYVALATVLAGGLFALIYWALVVILE